MTVVFSWLKNDVWLLVYLLHSAITVLYSLVLHISPFVRVKSMFNLPCCFRCGKILSIIEYSVRDINFPGYWILRHVLNSWNIVRRSSRTKAGSVNNNSRHNIVSVQSKSVYAKKHLKIWSLGQNTLTKTKSLYTWNEDFTWLVDSSCVIP